MTIIDISPSSLAIGYSLILIPAALFLWFRIRLTADLFIALIRMTVQLLFVGIYLEFVFKQDSFWLTTLWLIIMICVADISIAKGCGLTKRRFYLPLFIALFAGIIIPMSFVIGLVLDQSPVMAAQYAIPIGGMILGNCLRAVIVGVSTFYDRLRTSQNSYLFDISAGASRTEAVRPYMRKAFTAAITPATATMATIGLVSIPGMMTGVVLAGANPMVAIKYQIMIMLAIYTGTCLTVVLGITLTLRLAFTDYGTLKPDIINEK